MPPVWQVSSATLAPSLPLNTVPFLSCDTMTKCSPLGEYATSLMKREWNSRLLTNLNGGPWKKTADESSPPVTMRYGRVCLIDTASTFSDWPVISQTLEPESHMNTRPNWPPCDSPTAARRFESSVHAMSRTRPCTTGSRSEERRV